uniref:AAA+ ATPase domain-containing protein n=1 Tax=Panagrolaimus sp. ES5 TaxID=591445 RepID=A0AC34F8B2_9BILA
MALWVDKYRPTQLSQLNYHRDLSQNLSELVKGGNFPHLLFYGPDGAGKSTRIRCILKELYGNGADNVRMEYRNFETASGRKLELMVLSSLYHIEVTPSDVGIHDRVVVQELIKHMAQSQQIDTQAQKSFKVVILMEADTLSKDAQHALRRTMEKYAGSCKIIMCCNSVSKIIEPLRSRSMVIRLKSCLRDAALSESVEISDRFLDAIAERSNGNLRRGLLLLESAAAQYGKKLDSQKVIEPDWQCYIRDTAGIILKSCTSEGLLKVRTRLYDLLTRCIPTYVIFEELLEALLPHCDATIRRHVIESAAHFEHTSVLGSKEIYHLDAFVATFMAIYKNNQVLNNR